MRWYAKVRTPKEIVTLKVRAETESEVINQLQNTKLRVLEVISISNDRPNNTHNKFAIEDEIGMDIKKERFKKRHNRAKLIC